ncbi:MAG: class I SAM-dependent methyltransferase [Bacteroidetes bacterium]|nr:class I SAM-dependent methyltransferase [Bacteroidota bacterium]
MTTKNHWYDGLFYDRFIAPNQDPLFTLIRGLIHPEATILDVGCGTGRLAWQLSERCRLVHGIDPSHRNIARATMVWESRGKPAGVRFTVTTLGDHLPPPRNHTTTQLSLMCCMSWTRRSGCQCSDRLEGRHAGSSLRTIVCRGKEISWMRQRKCGIPGGT